MKETILNKEPKVMLLQGNKFVLLSDISLNCFIKFLRNAKRAEKDTVDFTVSQYEDYGNENDLFVNYYVYYTVTYTMGKKCLPSNTFPNVILRFKLIEELKSSFFYSMNKNVKWINTQVG